MVMTVATFKYLRDVIKNNPDVEKVDWDCGCRWIDPQGNWYVWHSNGYWEAIYYNGKCWYAFSDYKGECVVY